MFLKKIYFLLLLFLVSCSDTKNTRYQDTSTLEMPPEMEIVEKPAVAEPKIIEDIVDKGLGDSVVLSGPTEEPLIKIKKMFDRSWGIVEQALKLNEIEITDKNREEGVFYVNFDPDAQTSDGSELFDGMTFSFFNDEYEEAAYKLTVVWRESNTEVNAELAGQTNMDMLNDDEDFGGSVDAGAKLIKKLYKTIRDDLPLD